LPLLERDLTPIEIQNCEKACQQYVQTDTYEIEINNLNEVNEYFRILKDMVRAKDQEMERYKQNYKEISTMILGNHNLSSAIGSAHI
tara:strand:+ start:182 stop:442 length:261 start_codon:yes stop_codon:yes gene_type:complete